MRFRWIVGIVALIIVVALVATMHYTSRSKTSDGTPLSSQWKTSNPVLSPASSPLSWGHPLDASIQPIALPKDQLSAAEWYLPITAQSSISYILHDGRARWVVNQRRIPLREAPIDPTDQLSFASNGMQLAWITPNQQVKIVTPTHSQTLPAKAQAVGITPRNDIVVVGRHHVRINNRQEPWSIVGKPASLHTLIDQSRSLIVDDNGSINQVSVTSGHVRHIAAVRPQRWPNLLVARSLPQGVVLLLSRPASLPSYLLIVRQRAQLFWYRFESPTTPEVGSWHSTLVIANMASNGDLALLQGTSLDPLNVQTGIFSAGPQGIIWEGSTSFEKLVGYHS